MGRQSRTNLEGVQNMTGVPLIDAMLGVIASSIYAIIFAFFFIVGFLETATQGQLLGF